MQKELLTKKNYAAVGEEISHEMAANFIESFVKANPQEASHCVVGRNIIDQILAQPGCVGIRFYNALNENGHKTLVYVGLDASGKDILKKTVIDFAGNLTTEDGVVADRVPWIWPA